MNEFKGKVAVITGAASGIGRALAEHCASLKMKVVLADIEQAALDKAADELKAIGADVISVMTDVSKREDVEQLAQRTLAAFGQIHLLFNNAGIAAGGTAWDATWNDWEWVINVNLWGVIHGVKIFTPIMLAQNNDCRIINTSSSAGLMSSGFSAPYAATKHAVVALSENLYLALEQRKAKIKVSVLCPGLVHTNIDTAERNRPVDKQNAPTPVTPELQAGRAAFKALLETGMAPNDVANLVFNAIEKDQFYILTDPAWLEVVKLRTDKLLAMENPVSAATVIAKIMSLPNAK